MLEDCPPTLLLGFVAYFEVYKKSINWTIIIWNKGFLWNQKTNYSAYVSHNITYASNLSYTDGLPYLLIGFAKFNFPVPCT